LTPSTSTSNSFISFSSSFFSERTLSFSVFTFTKDSSTLIFVCLNSVTFFSSSDTWASFFERKRTKLSSSLISTTSISSETAPLTEAEN
uniref:Uncharacterized protein n=1 Tax=Amphimedon queenslandica TaxID=400682 RepID=A0A1X7SRW5_AMPQE